VEICEAPILNFAAVSFISKADGKESRTAFSRILYNDITDSSIVLCKLDTGRQHQIRVHLQYLGYPIKNDHLYNNEKIFGSTKSKLRDSYEKEEMEKIVDSKKIYHDLLNVDDGNIKSETDSNIKKCNECGGQAEFDISNHQIDLHCVSYSSKDFSFISLPLWLKDSDEMDTVRNFVRIHCK
ncbi:MAG: DRAP deaminase, partial [Paramarteilia canceri]